MRRGRRDVQDARTQAHPTGRAVIDRHHDELVAAEEQVNTIYFAWRAGRPTSPDAELDAMLERWRAVPDGGELVVEWSVERPARRLRSS